MPEPLEIIALAVGLGLLVLVLELVRRRQLGEEYALLWIVGSLGVLALVLARDALDGAARWLGIHYGPALLLLLLGVLVFLALLFFSVVVSRQRLQIERLIEDVAILEARLREHCTTGGEGTDRADTDGRADEHEDPARHP